MPRKKAQVRASNSTEFFSKEQFQKESTKIETAEIELGTGDDTQTVGIRFVGIPFSEHKKLAGLKADDISGEHLDFMVKLIQKSVVTEDGEPMFTIEELEGLNGPLFNKIGAAVLGQEVKNS